MTGLFERFFGRGKDRSAKRAMERLQFVLVTDRSQLSPEQLRQMQAEILGVIRKYCHIDEGAAEMKLEMRERMNYLVADIPLVKHPSSDEEPGRIGFALQTPSSALKSSEADEGSETSNDTKTDKDQSETASSDSPG